MKYFSVSTWVICLGADWCREREFTEDQVEALLYHEMLHMTLKETDEPGEEGKPAIRGHDYEVFDAEIRRYGFWDDPERRLPTVVQLRLDMEAASRATL